MYRRDIKVVQNMHTYKLTIIILQCSIRFNRNIWSKKKSYHSKFSRIPFVHSEYILVYVRNEGSIAVLAQYGCIIFIPSIITLHKLHICKLNVIL